MLIPEKYAKIIKEKLDIKQETYEKISLLLTFSFFLGIFVAFYFVPANSEFVNYFGSAQLPFAYILSGIVGTIALSIYTHIQKKTQSSQLFRTALLIMLFIAIVSRVSTIILNLIPHSQTYYYQRVIAFFVFIWAWPFIALTATITGGLAIRLFNLLEVKRFYGIVNLGGVLAAIISYFSIPLILKVIVHHYDLILIGSVGIIAALFLLNYIYKKFPEDSEVQKIHRKKNFAQFYQSFSSKKFLLWIFAGAIFSTIAIYIADFGFLITIKQQKEIFPTNESVARFMSIVFGLLKVGEFIISILSGRILTQYGLKFGLVAMAVVITSFEILAFGSAYIFGVSSILFLTFMTLNKMFERIIRRGIDDPSFNVLYQTLPDDFKLAVQTRVGLIQQFAIAIAGVILLVIQKLLSKDGFFRLELYPLSTLPILILWIFVAFNLYYAYKDRIRQILAEKKLFKLEYIEKDIFATDILQKYLLTDDINFAKFSVVVLSENNPRALEDYANFLLKVDDIIIRRAILNNIDATYSEKLVKTIEYIGNQIGFKEKELRRLILRALYQLDYSEIDEPIPFEKLKELVESQNIRQKILAAKYLYKHQTENDHILIEKLLECEDKSVKLAAIKIASKRNNKKLHLKLIELLKNPQYNNFLINILIEIGESILDDLDNFFNKVKNPNILIKIIQIYAKIGTPKAQSLLLKHLDYPDRLIQQSIIYALYYSDYQAKTDKEVELIKRKIFETVDNIIWFYASIKDIVREKNTLKLTQSLDLELTNTQEILFILLTFLHSKEIIDLIKSNIIGENTIFAIELIDNFIRPDIKRIIIPIFEKSSLGQKIKRLRKYFHHPQLGFEGRLKDIVLKDYRKVDIWTKVKAIELLGKLMKDRQIELPALSKLPKIDQKDFWTEEFGKEIIKKLSFKNSIPELVAILFHQSEIVYTTTAKILLTYNLEVAKQYIKLLPPDKQTIIFNSYENDDFLADRIKLLKRIYLFYTIPERSLINLAKIMRNVKLDKNQKIGFFTDSDNEDIIIVIKGKLTYKYNSEKFEFQRNDVIIRGLNLPQEAKELTIEKNANLILVNRFEFFNLLATDTELVAHLFDRMRF